MPNDDRPRWLAEITDELRAEPPVRPAWRSALLEHVAADGPPKHALAGKPPLLGGRRLVLHPLTGLAAAILCAAIGAVAATGVARWKAERVGSALAGVPAAVTAREVRFVLRAPGATRVALVGDFNGWTPRAMQRDAREGLWTAVIALPAGRHVYAFVVDGAPTADPLAPRAGEEDFGRPNSVVVVGGPAS
jgi:hypothetical protein